jgi:hypothetical protein
MTIRNVIRIGKLKQFVKKNFPIDSTLRNVIVMDKDILSREDYLSKIDIWMKIFRTEKR